VGFVDARFGDGSEYTHHCYWNPNCIYEEEGNWDALNLCMRVLNIQIVEGEHAVERHDEKLDLLACSVSHGPSEAQSHSSVKSTDKHVGCEQYREP
jgi:hypothetical protein